MRKKPDPAIIPLATRMLTEGVKVSEVCYNAKPPVASSTWSRWMAGGVPDLGTLRRLESSFEEILALETSDVT